MNPDYDLLNPGVFISGHHHRSSPAETRGGWNQCCACHHCCRCKCNERRNSCPARPVDPSRCLPYIDPLGRIYRSNGSFYANDCSSPDVPYALNGDVSLLDGIYRSMPRKESPGKGERQHQSGRKRADSGISSPIAQDCARGKDHSPPESTSEGYASQDVTDERAEELAEPSDEENVGGCKESKYSHPVYKKISLVNGKIHRMDTKEIRDTLIFHRQNTRGIKGVVEKRLKQFSKINLLEEADLFDEEPHFDKFVMMDFRCTTDRVDHKYPHEIIELFAQVIDWQRPYTTVHKSDQFFSLIKPKVNKSLPQERLKQIGLCQAQVNSGCEFKDVMQRFNKWLVKRRLFGEWTTALVVDCPWKIQHFLKKTCELNNEAFPDWAKEYITLRKSFCNFYQCKSTDLIHMMAAMELNMEGNVYSASDTVEKNMSKVLRTMILDACPFKINSHFDRVDSKAGLRERADSTRELPGGSLSDDRKVEAGKDGVVGGASPAHPFLMTSVAGGGSQTVSGIPEVRLTSDESEDVLKVC